ncbi:hypothetical protein sce9114 [Sorangium cellulosum So ce56]|uniref:PPM-type phosphatase domain-containing protein n=1 Tax=Sorangium cellulosum (strain So ce56) TaxID=448385 RepID=A9GCY5_SORC5|nr:hypothetical protein sce9114 [Sorangium cellulosum So ce56]
MRRCGARGPHSHGGDIRGMGSSSIGGCIGPHAAIRLRLPTRPAGHGEAELRVSGYRSALAARSIPCDERLVAHGAFTIVTGREAIREILDRGIVLEDGDVLVLYSDGVTEARNAHQEWYGLERLCAAIEAVQAAPVDAIRDRILEQVEGWCPSLDDDITILVARYRAPR